MIVAHVDLAADNRLQAVLLGRNVKIQGAVQVAVIGYGRGRQTEILGFGAQIVDADGPVQQAVFGMAMQMDKIAHGTGVKGCGWLKARRRGNASALLKRRR